MNENMRISYCNFKKDLVKFFSDKDGLIYCCFLCYWDSHAWDKHDSVKVWSERDSFEPGQRNIAEDPLVNTKNVILPLLHIKLGAVKNFVKAIIRNGNAFSYLKSKFAKPSEAKIKVIKTTFPTFTLRFLSWNVGISQ